MSDLVREAFETRFPPANYGNAYWCEKHSMYMRHAGAGLQVAVNVLNGMFEAWQAAISANGGEVEPVGYTGSGTLDALNQGAEGHIFPSPAPSHPVPLYLSPAVKDSLTVQSDPIGYADPDTLSDYREGERLHIPVYRPDASADWQDGVPVYLHPAPPSVAVPEGLVDMLKACQGWLGGDRESVEDDETDLFKWDRLQHFIDALTTAAPSPDHSGGANEVAFSDTAQEIENRQAYAAEHACPHCGGSGHKDDIADAGREVPDAVFAEEFTEWWEESGQFVRAGGGNYERTFAFQAWRHLYPRTLPATPSVPENEVKAQALEEFAAEMIALAGRNRTLKTSAGVTFAATEAKCKAARLRTAGDEGVE